MVLNFLKTFKLKRQTFFETKMWFGIFFSVPCKPDGAQILMFDRIQPVWSYCKSRCCGECECFEDNRFTQRHDITLVPYLRPPSLLCVERSLDKEELLSISHNFSSC